MKPPTTSPNRYYIRLYAVGFLNFSHAGSTDWPFPHPDRGRRCASYIRKRGQQTRVCRECKKSGKKIRATTQRIPSHCGHERYITRRVYHRGLV